MGNHDEKAGAVLFSQLSIDSADAIYKAVWGTPPDAVPNTSMPILQKLGFLTVGYATAFNWTP